MRFAIYMWLNIVYLRTNLKFTQNWRYTFLNWGYRDVLEGSYNFNRKLSCNLFQVVYSCDFCLNIMKKSCVSHKPWSRKMLETKFLSTLYVLPCRKFQFVQMTFPWSWHHLSRICRNWMLNKVTHIRQSYVVWKFPASFWLNNISCVCALNDRDLELAQLENVSKRDILFREHFFKVFS